MTRGARKALVTLALLSSLGSNAVATVKDRKAPLFDLPALKGSGRVALKPLAGKIVFVDFWASWCGPCRQELPELEKLKRLYDEKGVEIITVNLDSERDNALEMVKRLKLTLPVGLDPEKRAAAAYRLEAMPSSFIIDRSGIIRFNHEGFDGPADIETIRKELESLLSAAPAAPAR